MTHEQHNGPRHHSFRTHQTWAHHGALRTFYATLPHPWTWVTGYLVSGQNAPRVADGQTPAYTADAQQTTIRGSAPFYGMFTQLLGTPSRAVWSQMYDCISSEMSVKCDDGQITLCAHSALSGPHARPCSPCGVYAAFFDRRGSAQGGLRRPEALCASAR
ncbi:hypothetical protein OBBRIDRAFT_659139 [Obba rivulosa]|uniref:Uncharacterized protein n=1 Tax=Obba rivulosa TaxID=1052685 RepID=A0A8E2DJZ9_9APHY|nr:hypothetical protein OBBRIDRAFT_659139 [Obba rivulosa]